MKSTDVTTAFQTITGHAPERLLRSPGRINIIGEHTDYNDGFVLPGAVDRAIYFALRLNGTNRSNFHALDIDKRATDLDLTDPRRSGELWLDYLLGIADQFRQRGIELPGIDLVFGGDLPAGAGMSSSAALEGGMAFIWNDLTGAGISWPELARLCKESSNTFLGVPCGIMDQFASLNGHAGEVLLLDCRSLETERVTSELGDYSWLLFNSRVTHELGASAYPVRVCECAEGAAAIRTLYKDVEKLRDAAPAQVEAARHLMTDEVYRRCRYVTGEQERTQAAVAALRTGDMPELGRLLTATHRGLRDDYEVSCAEIDFLVDEALRQTGVLGARIMGGGFGGCTLNLVRTTESETVIAHLTKAYEQAFGIAGEAYNLNLVDGTDWLVLK
ncbi:MAG: galactokinase [Saprospiraceae bacterium]